MTLNGVPLTDQIFREHCFVVKQHDKHWPYLTCRETLRYAAELYDVAAAEDIDAVVEEIIQKMGLVTAADTRNASMSGGQRRRLSIGIALLKQPTLLFLDEPTSGLVRLLSTGVEGTCIACDLTSFQFRMPHLLQTLCKRLFVSQKRNASLLFAPFTSPLRRYVILDSYRLNKSFLFTQREK